MKSRRPILDFTLLVLLVLFTYYQPCYLFFFIKRLVSSNCVERGNILSVVYFADIDKKEPIVVFTLSYPCRSSDTSGLIQTVHQGLRSQPEFFVNMLY